MLFKAVSYNAIYIFVTKFISVLARILLSPFGEASVEFINIAITLVHHNWLDIGAGKIIDLIWKKYVVVSIAVIENHPSPIVRHICLYSL